MEGGEGFNAAMDRRSFAAGMLGRIVPSKPAVTLAPPRTPHQDARHAPEHRPPHAAALRVRTQHDDGIRYVDLIEGERVLNEVIYECQRGLEEIRHAKLDLEAWSRGRERG